MATNREDMAIHEALNISKDWTILNESRIQEDLDKSSTVSDAIEAIALRIKTEEFGEGDYTLSAYEKKLIFSGLHLGNLIVNMKAQDAMHSMIRSMIEGSGKEKP
jgi:hypothetical protein